MKRIPKPVFFIVAILILAFTATSLLGISYYKGDTRNVIVKGLNDIRWGIDIRGGVEASFTPANGVDATKEQLDAAKAIIETRMVAGGITDYEIYTDENSDRIITRFPAKSNEELNPETAIKELAATAVLTFTDEQGNVLMDGSCIKNAEALPDPDTAGAYLVALEFNAKGVETFSTISAANIGKQISINMDDETLCSPVVQEAISQSECTITGNFTAEEASVLANQINGGALPFALKAVSFGTISPTLGQNSLSAMGLASIIAMILISLFMIIRYRVPGVIAVIALFGQLAISVAAITKLFPAFNSFTMTLPGIAGIILSIGMGVDANIITAERIKDEFRQGKTLDGAIENGTKNSLSAIIDGNMTVVIVSIILLLVFGPTNVLSWLFGASTTGTIYAFGYTLLMGVISNFIMGVFFSRVMLKSVAGFKCLRKKWLFGGAK